MATPIAPYSELRRRVDTLEFTVGVLKADLRIAADDLSKGQTKILEQIAENDRCAETRHVESENRAEARHAEVMAGQRQIQAEIAAQRAEFREAIAATGRVMAAIQSVYPK